MTNQYDRVSYPDKVQFASEPDDDPHDGVGHHAGNGIYNDYTVKITPKQYSESFKIACFRIEKTRRSAFILCGILFVILLLIIIIAVATHAHISSQHQETQRQYGEYVSIAQGYPANTYMYGLSHNMTAFILCGILFVILLLIIIIIAVATHAHISSQHQETQRQYGLLAYPHNTDGSPVIAFDPASYDTYRKYVENLEHHMNDYDIIKQESHLDKYIPCANNKTAESLPAGQVCMQTPITFGPYCQHMNLYGYGHEQPCVLLVLKLVEGVKPVPYNESDFSDQTLKKLLSEPIRNGLIPIHCEGKTEEDRKNLMIHHLPEDSLVTDIQYHPSGFPLYFFPVKGDSNYINPAVMVQFRSVRMHVDVAVRCTAWVQDPENKSPRDEGSRYSTEFTLRMTHSA